MTELPNGLKFQDVKIGDGPEAKKGSRVGMRYIGKFLNGQGFDKNVKGKPVSFLITLFVGLVLRFVYSSPSRLERVKSSRVG